MMVHRSLVVRQEQRSSLRGFPWASRKLNYMRSTPPPNPGMQGYRARTPPIAQLLLVTETKTALRFEGK